MRVQLESAAEEDLIGIWTYIAGTSPVAADRLLRRIDARCAQLAVHPFIGRGWDDVMPNLRQLVVSPYIIFYRVSGNVVSVLRVLHGKRDITSDNFP